MATARDYPVTFGYGAKLGNYTHRGEDRAMPSGTPVIVNGTEIGRSGNTGMSTGPHLHLQVGKDPWAQNTVKPSAHWFKGTEVVTTGTASEWGNYVIVKNGAYYCVYAHLSKIKVKKGQKLGGSMKPTKTEIKKVYKIIPGRTPSSSEVNHHAANSTWPSFILGFAGEMKRHHERDAETKAALEVVKKDLAKANKAVTSLSSRPTKEEMQRALDEAEKRVKDAQAACEVQEEVNEQESVESWLTKLIQFVRSVWTK